MDQLISAEWKATRGCDVIQQGTLCFRDIVAAELHAHLPAGPSSSGWREFDAVSVCLRWRDRCWVVRTLTLRLWAGGIDPTPAACHLVRTGIDYVNRHGRALRPVPIDGGLDASPCPVCSHKASEVMPRE